MNEYQLFQYCVDILKGIASFFGISYEMANIVIFVVIYPVLLGLFIFLSLRYYIKYRRLR